MVKETPFSKDDFDGLVQILKGSGSRLFNVHRASITIDALRPFLPDEEVYAASNRIICMDDPVRFLRYLRDDVKLPDGSSSELAFFRAFQKELRPEDGREEMANILGKYDAAQPYSK